MGARAPRGKKRRKEKKERERERERGEGVWGGERTKKEAEK